MPWANPTATWYHEYINYPIQALTAAAELQEYTLTDRGTILSVDQAVSKAVTVYKAATDSENDVSAPGHRSCIFRLTDRLSRCSTLPISWWARPPRRSR